MTEINQSCPWVSIFIQNPSPIVSKPSSHILHWAFNCCDHEWVIKVCLVVEWVIHLVVAWHLLEVEGGSLWTSPSPPPASGPHTSPWSQTFGTLTHNNFQGGAEYKTWQLYNSVSFQSDQLFCMFINIRLTKMHWIINMYVFNQLL